MAYVSAGKPSNFLRTTSRLGGLERKPATSYLGDEAKCNSKHQKYTIFVDEFIEI